MNTVSNNNKRIAKNTLYMYFRMAVTMLVQLYTSRVVLQNLGIDNYGVYNVVGAFVVAFSFIQTPIASAIQRFLNFELGSKNGDANSIMSLSFLIYSVLSFILFAAIELIGIWYMNNKMVIPLDRFDAARFTFHLSIMSLLVTIMRSPLEALLIAHERMSYYAYVSVLEVILKLANALSLSYVAVDKLKLYACNQLAIVLIVSIVLYVFCKRNYSDEIKIKKGFSKKKFKEILSFSGWSLFSGIASMTANHGTNILLNVFFGVTVNAAMGVAVQIQVAVQQFVGNFQKAFNPQIVKLYASKELEQMCTLVSRSSRFSYFLLFMIVCPISFNIDVILKFWLGSVPKETSVFCIYLLIWQLLECLMAPMWTAVNATGRIKKYNLVMNPIILSVIFFSYISLKMGCAAYSIVLIKCLVDVALLIARLLFVKSMIGLQIKQYFADTLLPVCLITIVSVLVLFWVNGFVHDVWVRLLLNFPSFVIFYAILLYFVGFTKNERAKIFDLINKKLFYGYERNNKN